MTASPSANEVSCAPVVIVESYNGEWPEWFREEEQRLRIALGGRVTAIEHIGSTAIPGLVAKPIIDIAAAPNLDPFAFARLVEPLGYRQHQRGPKNGVYVKTVRAERTHILHIFASEQWENCNQRVFRDKLLRDGAARERYGKIKCSIAVEATNGRNYTAANSAIVQALLNEERADRGLPPTTAWDK